jgi:4a-hydroxytetrahydrobiopterin dehydratase
MKRVAKVPSKSGLAGLSCQACESGAGRLKTSQIKALQKQLGGDWMVKASRQLEKNFKFPDFQQALAFVNRVGALAEAQGHHPDIFLTWGKVRLQISTHSAGGLTENDFILAAKIGKLK